MNVFVEKALGLIAQGYTVMPLAGKKPVVTEWQNLRNITSEQIYDWERAGLWRNIGMVCGAASKNTVVVDFDGLAGFELFKTVFPALLDTMMVATGSGKGMHVYFSVDLLPDSISVMSILVDGGELVNIEFKADGKQVVIPPSAHPDTLQEYTVYNRAPVKHISDLSAVQAWARSLKPSEAKEWQPPASYSTSTNLNPKLLAAVESYFMSQPHKMQREWINCACPDKLAHKHGDESWSFGYNPRNGAGHCFSCNANTAGGMNLKTILPLIGINANDYGGFYERTENSSTFDMRIAGQPIPPVVALPATIPVVTRSSRLSTYMDRLLDFETPVTNSPVPFPLKVLHQFGGMAKVVKPGKLIGIVGVSGGGKTSLLETCVDGLLSVHVPALVWSPEWCADEFVERAVQRNGGVMASDLYMHEIYKDEYQRGIKNGVGVELTKEQIDSATAAVRTLRSYTEEVGYLEMPFLTLGYLQASIDATLKAIDFKPRVLVIDYIQLFHAMETNQDLTMYNLLLRIKAICQQFGLVGIIASQVTKSSSKDNVSGKLLDAYDARYVNDDAFNLFVTINPDYHEVTKERQYSAVLNIAKNSMGRRGKVRVAVNWEKLLFSDTPHMNQEFGIEEPA